MRDSAELQYARLRWRCRRGMRELDGVLQDFLKDSFTALGDDDKARFEAILELPDPDLYAYLAGRAKPRDRKVADLIGRIRASRHPDP